jgi:hypothetical protein
MVFCLVGVVEAQDRRNVLAGVRFLHEARKVNNAVMPPAYPGRTLVGGTFHSPLRFNWMNAAMVRRRQWVRIPPEAQCH